MLSAPLTFMREVFFPPLCYACKSELSLDTPLCGSCLSELNSEWKTICPVCQKEKTFLQKRRCSHAPAYLSTLSYITLFNHSTVRGLIHTLKYSGIQNAVSPFLPLLEKERVNLFRIPADIIIPLPLHARRERERGFNQSVLISQYISDILSMPFRGDILLRRRSSPPQAQNKRRSQRERNVKGLFKVAREVPKGASMLLVDDVSTSGATLEEAAKVLINAGAGAVHAFTLAREE